MRLTKKNPGATTVTLVLSILLLLLRTDYSQPQDIADDDSGICTSDLHQQGAFLNDPCCFQAQSERRQCDDSVFCTGVMISHGSSALSGCCDEYSSCQQTKDLNRTLNILYVLSIADFCFSSVVVLVLIYKSVSKYVQEEDQVEESCRKCNKILLWLEGLGLVCGLAIISVVVTSNARDFARAMVQARCFTAQGDEGKIDDIIDLFDSYYNVAIVEVVIDGLLVVIHVFEVYRDPPFKDDQRSWGMTETIGCILDLLEWVLAFLGLFILLIEVIDEFDGLYKAMLDEPGDLAEGSSVPCIYSCCLEAFVRSNGLFPLPSSSPSTAPTRSPAPTASSQPSTLPTISHQPSVSAEPTPMPTVPPTRRPSPAPTVGSTLGGTVWTQVGQELEGLNYRNLAGISLSLSADGSIVAFGGENPVVIRVFAFESTRWVQRGNTISNFGSSVDLSSDGSALVVGRSKSARVFDYDQSTGSWIQRGDDLSGGYAVAISADGNMVIAGNTRGGPIEAGVAHVYEWTDSTGWSQVGGDIVGSSDGDYFGDAVAISGDASTVAVGATQLFYDDGAGYARVYEFDENGGDWVQQGRDLVGDADNDFYGGSLSLSSSGNMLAVGANGHGSSGLAQVFQRRGSNWSRLAGDIVGETAGSEFGSDVALSWDGSVLAVGAQDNNSPNGLESGHIRVYEFVSSRWVKRGNDIDGVASGDNFGETVAISRDGRIVSGGGRAHDGENGDISGHVRVFRLE